MEEYHKITSTSNGKIRRLLSLQRKAKARQEEGVLLAEGYKLCREAPPEDILEIYISETFQRRESKQFSFPKEKTYLVTDSIFKHISDTETPQGILCVVKRRMYTPEELGEKDNPLLLLLEEVQDPGNVGTILRSAEAAGVSGIFLTKGCADIYQPKVVRASMGAVFRLPLCQIEQTEEVLPIVKSREIRVLAAHLQGEHFYEAEDYRKGCLFLIGNESSGLRDSTVAFADGLVKIPMQGKTESLNAAIAASVLVFEAARQRRIGCRGCDFMGSMVE